MKTMKSTVLALTLGLAAVHFSAAPAAAQASGSGKIAVIEVQRVLSECKENKDSTAKLRGLQDKLDTMQKSHKAQLDDKQSTIKNAAAGFNHDAAVAELDKMNLTFKMDESLAQAEIVRDQAKSLVSAYEHMKAAVTEVAKSKGIDLVVVSTGNEVPANATDIGNIEQLGNLLFNRSVVYSSEQVNVTAAVIASMDQKYVPAAAGR